MNATIKLEKNHFPVMLNELVDIISPLYGGTFIDCTLGQGGYTSRILNQKNNEVIALDRDKAAIKIANKLKLKFGNRFKFKNFKFSDIDQISIKQNKIKGIIYDLGFSLNQINDQEKKISFNSKGSLDMRLGINDFSANEVIHQLSEKELSLIFKVLGEENMHKIIAKKIVKEREKKALHTEDLVKIIDAVKRKKKQKIHNSTKVFQSLRMFVNNEISELINGLINGFKILPIGGVMVVVTFHSLEDKITKYFFKNYSEEKNLSRYLPESLVEQKIFKLIEKKPILPSKHEISINPPSRSAKLRYAFKIKNNLDFEKFKNKFKYLLDIENISRVL